MGYYLLNLVVIVAMTAFLVNCITALTVGVLRPIFPRLQVERLLDWVTKITYPAMRVSCWVGAILIGVHMLAEVLGWGH